MPDFDFAPYIFSVLGISCLLSAIFKKPKPKAFFDKAESADGIVFELGYSNRLVHTGDIASVRDKITVRFLTKKQEWITADIPVDGSVFYTGQYKAGDKIKLLYNPGNPRDFVVLTKQLPGLALLIVIVAGFLFLGIGVYMILMN